tara:strand:+ start:832 stop:3243 length:2412 start_codon:yes stop_codon:yes gene_type:complete
MVRNFYQPDPGPDWTKRLNEIYARQTRQRNEHHQNLLQQSAELEKADPGVANLRMFKQILETTKTGVDVYNAYNSPEAKEKTAKKNKNDWDNMSIEEQNSYRLRWKLDKKEIYEEDEAFFKKIKNDFKLKDTEAAKELLKKAQELSGRRILRFQEASAAEQVQLMTNTAHAKFLDGNTAAKDEWDLAAGDPILQAKQQREWRKNELDKLAYTKEVQSTVLDEINRQTKTKETTGSNLFKTEKEALELRQLYTQINAQSVVANPDDSAAFIHGLINERKDLFWDIEGGPTATQQAVESVVGDLYRMGKTGKLTRDTYNKMLTGKIDGHSGGDTLLKAFLDKNGVQESHILEGIEEYENADYATRESLVETDYQQTFVAAADGKLSQEDYKAKVELFNRMPLKDSKAKLDRLDKVFHTNQDQVTTEDIISNWSPKIKNGTLDKHEDEIKDIGNINAQDKLNEIRTYQKNAATEAGLTDKLNSIKTTVIGERNKGIFGTPGGTQKTQRVYEDIQQNYRLLFFKNLEDARALSKGGPVDIKAITMKTDSEIETYKVSNGFGIPLGEEGSGKFSVKGTSGEYDNYTKSVIGIQTSDAFTSQTLSYNPTNAKNWESGVLSRRQSQPNAALRYKEAGGIFTNEMLAYYAVNGKPSEEMLYIAGRENLNISRALGYAINALVDSDDKGDKQFAKNYNLDQIETANGSDEIILKAGYDAVTKLNGTSQTDLNNLLARAKRNGLDSLDGVQIERLLVYTGETYQQSEAATQTTNLLNNIDMFKRAGISEDAIKEWIQEEINKRKSFSNTITAD